MLLSLQQHEEANGGEEPGIRLSAISKDVGMSAEVLLPLCRRLEKSGLIRTLQRDTFGDNQVALTEAARQLLSAPGDVELVARLRSI